MTGYDRRSRGARGVITAVRLGVALLVSLLSTGGADAGPAVAGAGSGAHLSLSLRPSHGGIYRAEVVERIGPMRVGAEQWWIVRVTRADGTPVEDASIQLSAWMPDTGERSPRPVRASAHLGDGRYRISGLRIGGSGWWNFPLRIAAPAGVDSLAFNVALPDGAPAAAPDQNRADGGDGGSAGSFNDPSRFVQVPSGVHP